MKNICFRVDSSTIIGTGHVVRCLTLAGQMRGGGHAVSFICRELPGDIIEQILKAGYEVHKLPKADYDNLNSADKSNHRFWLAVDWPTDAKQSEDILDSLGHPVDLLVVDHYALDMNWEKEVEKYFEKLMVIDDLADREHICDFLLDQNYYKNMEQRYDRLVPKTCAKMIGPSFALLRDEFYKTRVKQKPRDGRIRKVMVFFGGSDASNQTEKVLESILHLDQNSIHFDIIVGQTDPHLKKIENICANLENVTLHCQIDYMAELMAQADLAVSGGGTTTWERCCLGLPSLTMAMAENQVRVAELSQEVGFAKYLGYFTEVSSENITQAINDLLKKPDELVKMSNIGKRFVDGSGTVRVIKNIIKTINSEQNVKL